MCHRTSSVWHFETVECFTWMLSFWWLFSWKVNIFPSICWMCSHDFSFIFFIESCGNVDRILLAHDRNTERGAAISHYILQKKSSLPWSFFCISDFVSCNEVNLYRAAIISFYTTWNGSNSVQFYVMSEHNCHYCGGFTELHQFAERWVWFPWWDVCNIFWGCKWGDPICKWKGSLRWQREKIVSQWHLH